MTEKLTETDPTGSLRFLAALHQAYNEPGHRRTGHGPNPTAETIAANPENKRAMDQTVEALYDLLHRTADNHRQAAESLLESHPQHSAIVRQAILPILEPAHLAGSLDSSILAMGATDTPSMEDSEAQNPTHILANHSAKLQLALLTAERTVSNMTDTIKRSLWNTTTALSRTVTITPLTIDTTYQLQKVIRALVNSQNERTKEATKILRQAWHELEG